MDKAGLAIVVVDSQVQAIQRGKEFFANLSVQLEEIRQAQEEGQIVVEDMGAAGAEFGAVFDGAVALDEDDDDLFGE